MAVQNGKALKEGDVIQAKKSSIKILKKLGGGGQGNVYEVEYNGKRMCLKWYHPHYLKKLEKIQIAEVNGYFKPLFYFKDSDHVSASGVASKKFYHQMVERYEKGSPSADFAWPIDYTTWNESSQQQFGYVMEKIDMGTFKSFKYYLHVEHARDFHSGRHMITGLMNFVKTMQLLHSAGWCYQDINPDNVCMDDHGNVKVLDTDNIMPNGCSLGLTGMPEYQAPEVILGSAPDKYSDYFAEALFIFYVLMGGQHPFLGSYCQTHHREFNEEFASDPIFIFDPNDKRNVLTTENSFAEYQWPQLPDYIRDAFIRTFGKNGVKDPKSRLTDMEWIELLDRMRSDHYRCTCGNSLYLKEDGVTPTQCADCGKQHIAAWGILCSGSKRIPLKPKTAIYCSALGFPVKDFNVEFLRALVDIDPATKKPALMLHNMLKVDWKVVYPKTGEEKIVKNGEHTKMIFGMKIILQTKTPKTYTIVKQ